MHDDTSRNRPTRPQRTAHLRTVVSEELPHFMGATASALREIACGLVGEPFDHERLTVLVSAAMAAHDVSTRAVRALETGGSSSCPLEAALETAVTLARPYLRSAALGRCDCKDARTKAREAAVVRAIHVALLVVRNRGARATVEATTDASRARIRLSWLGAAYDAESPPGIAAAAELAFGLGGSLRETDDGIELTVPLAPSEGQPS
jgi:hypothetical protein